jgi:queuine/archaeosine tRNA-ribosyltransferase
VITNNKTIIKTDTLYFPAMGGTLLSSIEKPKDGAKFDYNFYNPKGTCPFYYGKILVSIGPYLVGRKMKEPDIVDRLKIDRKYVKIFGDSAGYQIATGKLNYSDELRDFVWNWQNKYVDIALPIDIPPVITTKAGDVATETKQRASYEQSLKNIKWVHDRLDKANCLYLNVQQGRGIDLIEHWYKGVKNFKDFKGWAIGSAGSSVFHTIFAILRMFELGEFEDERNRIFHLFGVSTAIMIPTIIYLEKKLHDLGYKHARVSFDSSTPLLQAAFGNFLYTRNRTASWSYMKIKNTYDYMPYKGTKFKMPCLCPICSQTETMDNWMDSENMKTKSRWYSVTALHNMFHMLDFIVGCETVINMNLPDLSEEFFGKRVTGIFKMIDGAFEAKSPTKWAIHHRHSIQSTEDKLLLTQKQTSLGDF